MADVAAFPHTPSQQHKLQPPADSNGDNLAVQAALKKVHDDLIAFLRAPPNVAMAQMLAQLEQSIGRPREQFAYALGVVIAVYLVFGSLAALVCNLIGFAYPSYASVKAIRTEGKDDDTQWLTYWTVFGAFAFIDFFVESALSWFPFYYLLKAIFLVYLYLPQTRGALQLYRRAVDPAVTVIDAWHSNAVVVQKTA